MSKIKICGLKRKIDIDYVNEALPDYIGFVFAESKRRVNEEEAAYLKASLKPQIKAVGVFVNENMEKIIRLCRNGTIDLVQLHGDEDTDYINNLKQKITNPVINAIRVRTSKDILKADQSNSDYLLFDAYKEGSYGGLGESFDWNLIQTVKKPFFLAGGIHCNNVVTAMEQIHPYAVDVSSGVETDGVKDRNKIIEIIKKVRSVS